MKRSFAKAILERAREDKRIILLVGDLGYKMFDAFKEELLEQYVNCGAAEQAMLDIAVGLARSGKIPVCYSITPFLCYRPFETIRTYLAREGHHVILVGSGRDDDYKHDGYSHDATDIPIILSSVAGMKMFVPKEPNDVPCVLRNALEESGPVLITLTREVPVPISSRR